MTRLWMMHSETPPWRTLQLPGWACQLVHAEITHVGVVLDFVALEAFPLHHARCERGAPFTIQIGATPDEEWRAHISAWATSADLVTIVAGYSHGMQRLCLSSGDEHVLIELDDHGAAPPRA